MFKLNENEEYVAELNGVRFICESVEDGFEETAKQIAQCYEDKLQDIAEFMLEEGIEEVYGELDAEQIIDSLGAPLVDLDRELVVYLEHTLDEEHIIEFEFSGILDELFYLNIDG